MRNYNYGDLNPQSSEKEMAVTNQYLGWVHNMRKYFVYRVVNWLPVKALISGACHRSIHIPLLMNAPPLILHQSVTYFGATL